MKNNQPKPNLKGFLVDDYIIFYYPQKDGIAITKIAYGYRDLEKFLESY
jgi:toxin ParE1/3/4